MQNKAETTQKETDSSVFLQADKRELLDVIEQNYQLISQQKSRIKILEEALRLSRCKRFAPSSEKSDGQERLFDEAEQAADGDIPPEPQTTLPKKKEKTGRKPFSKHIPRVPVFIDLTDEEKAGAVELFYTKVRSIQ